MFILSGVSIKPVEFPPEVLPHVDPELGYNEEFDAYYRLDTLEWTEGLCGDPGCEFCCWRPERSPAG